MKALYFDGEKAVYKEDAPMPQCRQDQSLLQIMLSAVCNTDREILKGYKPDFRGIMGHEFVAKVLDSPDRTLIGKTVVGEMNEGCGVCLYCRTGREKHCTARKELGISRDGCFAEYMALSTHLIHPVPEGLASEEAVFTEPLAAAMEITEQVHMAPSSKVALIGDGRLAFMIAQVLALTGVSLTVIGKHDEKLALFAPYADTVLVSAIEETEPGRERDPGDCFDYVVEATGNESGILLALSNVRKMGTIILKSTYAGKCTLNLNALPIGEITIVGSRCGSFESALKLLAAGNVHFPPIELHELKDYEAAFASKAFKAGFRF